LGFDCLGSERWKHVCPFDEHTRLLKNEHLLPPNLWEIPMDVAPAEQGKAIYHLYCQRCHGIDRSGSPPSIPSLVDAPNHFGEDVIRTVVKNGIQEMPAFPDLSTLHLTNLMLYLSNPGLAPGPLEEPKAPEPPPAAEGGAAAPVKYWSGYNLFTAIIKPPWSTITAYDLNTGTIKWQVPFGEAPPATKGKHHPDGHHDAAKRSGGDGGRTDFRGHQI
jgi:quinoprotein glucose dehydrogenase